MVGEASFFLDPKNALELILLVFVVTVSAFLQIGVSCRARPPERNAKGLQSFRRRYLLVYCLCTFGDWIQGAYVYALYSAYGYSQRAIGLIFVVGYASSASFGTLLASAGDRHGHKLNVLLYCLIYSLSCGLAHSDKLIMLLLGRALAGMAYSLLFTAFESWAVAEVDAKGLGRACLSNIFGAAVATSAIAAVVSGVVGQSCVGYDGSDRRHWFARSNTTADTPSQHLVPLSLWGHSAPTDASASARLGRPFDPSGTEGLPALADGLARSRARRALGGADIEDPAAPLPVTWAGSGAAGGASAGGVGVREKNPYLAVFDVSAVILIFAAVSVQILWEERTGAQYLEDPPPSNDNVAGEKQSRTCGGPVGKPGLFTFRQSLREVESGMRIVWADEAMLMIGSLNALYEGSLFLFVFVWTPVLEHRKALEDDVPPHGLAFSLFMVCKLTGSLVFVLVQQKASFPVHSLLNAILLISAVALSVPVFMGSYAAALISFCFFEGCFGAYWPAMATLRAEVLPDSMRATVASVFRVPLNMLVIGGLVLAAAIDDEGVLEVCALMMFGCFALSYRLRRRRGALPDTSQDDVRGRVVVLSEKNPTDLPVFLMGESADPACSPRKSELGASASAGGNNGGLTHGADGSDRRRPSQPVLPAARSGPTPPRDVLLVTKTSNAAAGIFSAEARERTARR